MFALRTAAIARLSRPAVRTLRSYHIENKVNSNTPFNLQDDSKGRLTSGLITVGSLAFVAPFLMSAFRVQEYKG